MAIKKNEPKNPKKSDEEVNPVGRPMAFSTPQELYDKCNEYFGKWESSGRPLTVAGLINYLKISRWTWDNYANGEYDDVCDPEQDNFSATIEMAKRHIEVDKLENGLLGKYNSSIAKFDLVNNHNYTEKQEVNKTVKVRPLNVRFIDDDEDPFADYDNQSE